MGKLIGSDPDGAGLQEQKVNTNGEALVASVSQALFESASEKGNSYNLYCQSTGQPSNIVNCKFSNSSGYGVKLLSSNKTLTDCQILNSPLDGLYSTSSN